jgi:hypothetical protein
MTVAFFGSVLCRGKSDKKTGALMAEKYVDIDELRLKVAGMADDQQRTFMRELAMQTHVAFNRHLIEEADTKLKVNEMHRALFDPLDGLVNLRKWLCRLATWAGVGLAGIISATAGIASFGHNFGWW